MRLSAWLSLILLFTPCLAQAQQAAPSSSEAPDQQTDYRKITDHFFEKVKAGQFTDAAHVLVDTNPQDEFNVEKHESVAVPLQKIQDSFGAFKDFKYIVVKTLGDGIGYVYGLAIYERSQIRFEFMFYKDGSSWRLFHIDFNLQFIPEIRELAGVHIPLTPVYAPAAAAPAPAKPVTPAAPPAPAAQPSAAPVPAPVTAPSFAPSPAPPVPPSASPAPPSTNAPAAPAPSPAPHP